MDYLEESCKILAQNAFLGRSLLAIHSLQRSGKESISSQDLERNLFLWKILQGLHFLVGFLQGLHSFSTRGETVVVVVVMLIVSKALLFKVEAVAVNVPVNKEANMNVREKGMTNIYQMLRTLKVNNESLIFSEIRAIN